MSFENLKPDKMSEVPEKNVPTSSSTTGETTARSRNVNWEANADQTKETFRTVVINYNYVKPTKIPESIAAAKMEGKRKRETWKEKLAEMTKKRNALGEDTDSDYHLNRLYEENVLQNACTKIKANGNRFEPIVEEESTTSLSITTPPTLATTAAAAATSPKTEGSNCCIAAKPNVASPTPAPPTAETTATPTSATLTAGTLTSATATTATATTATVTTATTAATTPIAATSIVATSTTATSSATTTATNPAVTTPTCALRNVAAPSPPIANHKKTFDAFEVIVISDDDDDDALKTSKTTSTTSHDVCTLEKKIPNSMEKIIPLDSIENIEEKIKIKLTLPEIPSVSSTQLLKIKMQPPNTFKQRQLELHRHRIAIEQKRLELLELKLARERDEMIRDQVLYEKELELKTSQLKQMNGDKCE